LQFKEEGSDKDHGISVRNNRGNFKSMPMGGAEVLDEDLSDMNDDESMFFGGDGGWVDAERVDAERVDVNNAVPIALATVIADGPGLAIATGKGSSSVAPSAGGGGATPPVASFNFCPACGVKNEIKGGRFCTSCGANFEDYQ